MRIAMVTEYAYPVLGGVPEHVHNLSRELARARATTSPCSPAWRPFGMKRPGARDRRREPLAARLPDRARRRLDADRLATARSPA